MVVRELERWMGLEVVLLGVEWQGGVEMEMRSSSGMYCGSSSVIRVRLSGEV